MSRPKRKFKWLWLLRLRRRYSLLRLLAGLAMSRLDEDKIAAEAAEAARRFLLAKPRANENVANITEHSMALASMARSFIDHPYWVRMIHMLANSEKAELDTLLDPTAVESHPLSRASVAYIRKLQSMPFIDLKQGEEAVKAVEKYEARHGWSSPKARDSAER